MPSSPPKDHGGTGFRDRHGTDLIPIRRKKELRSPNRRPFENLLAAGAILLLVILNLLAYHGRLPRWAPGWRWSDKLIHFGVYACLTLGLYARLGSRRVRIGKISFPLILLLSTILALGDEGIQALSPVRSPEAYDLLSDLAGISLAWLAMPKSRRLTAPLEEAPDSPGNRLSSGL